MVVPISAVQQSDPVIHIDTFPFLYYLPSWSNPRVWIWFPVLYSRTSLLVHSKCNSLYQLAPNSQSIPLPLKCCFLKTAFLIQLIFFFHNLSLHIFSYNLLYLSLYTICVHIVSSIFCNYTLHEDKACIGFQTLYF